MPSRGAGADANFFRIWVSYPEVFGLIVRSRILCGEKHQTAQRLSALITAQVGQWQSRSVSGDLLTADDLCWGTSTKHDTLMWGWTMPALLQGPGSSCSGRTHTTELKFNESEAVKIHVFKGKKFNMLMMLFDQSQPRHVPPHVSSDIVLPRLLQGANLWEKLDVLFETETLVWLKKEIEVDTNSLWNGVEACGF